MNCNEQPHPKMKEKKKLQSMHTQLHPQSYVYGMYVFVLL